MFSSSARQEWSGRAFCANACLILRLQPFSRSCAAVRDSNIQNCARSSTKISSNSLPIGMVGQGVLRECLLDPEVTAVLSIVRSSTGQQHPKLREIVHKDFFEFASDRNGRAGRFARMPA